MKRFLFKIAFIALFVCMVIFTERSQSKRYALINNTMLNHFSIEGRVNKVSASNNRSFGIIQITIDSIYAGNYIDTPLKNGIYPYKVRNHIAEIYTEVPNDIQKGDRLSVKSDKMTVYYHLKADNRSEQNDLWINIDPTNIEFVNEHSSFNR